MSPPNTPQTSKRLCTLPDIFARSIRAAAKHFPDFLNDAYTSYSPRPVHPSRARIRRVELRKDKSGQRCEYLLAFVTLDGRPWTEAALGVIKCDRYVLSGDPAKHDAEPTTRIGYWVGIAAALYNFLSNKPPVYDGDRFEFFSPADALVSRIIRRSSTLYVHEYTTLPAAGPVDVTQPQLDFPPWSRDATVPPTLFHLAAAASLLEKLHPKYIMLERQCFWYTTMLYYALVGQDALDVEVEGSAKRVTIEDAYRPEAVRGTSGPATNTKTFRNLFQRVTRKDIKELCTDEELDAIAYQTRLVNLYGGLRDAMLEDRERFGRWGPLASPDKNAVIDALGAPLTDMEMEIERTVARRKLEADRIAMAAQREAARAELKAETAATVRELKAETAAAIKELETEAAAVARELEAQNTAAMQELKAAAAKELEAERARSKAERAAAQEREEAIAAEGKRTEERLAALKEEHAATRARFAELERQIASAGAARSGAAQV